MKLSKMLSKFRKFRLEWKRANKYPLGSVPHKNKNYYRRGAKRYGR